MSRRHLGTIIAAVAFSVTAVACVPRPAPVPVAGQHPQHNHQFLVCVRHHESDTAGSYGAVSPGGAYRGAYQFDQRTWNSVAASIGRHDLVNRQANTVSPWDQDEMAWALYGQRGGQPWNGSGCR